MTVNAELLAYEIDMAKLEEHAMHEEDHPMASLRCMAA